MPTIRTIKSSFNEQSTAPITAEIFIKLCFCIVPLPRRLTKVNSVEQQLVEGPGRKFTRTFLRGTFHERGIGYFFSDFFPCFLFHNFHAEGFQTFMLFYAFRQIYIIIKTLPFWWRNVVL